MRKILGTAALAVALGAAVLPVTSASAYCDGLIYSLTGRCDNACTVAARAYANAEDRSGGALPDVEFICFA